MREKLCDYFARLRFDDAVRVVIVTGAGRAFCSGADVDRMAGQPHDLRADRERMQRGGHTFIRALHAIEKPVIAAVRGPAVGIGWSIALACDLVVASKTARFSQILMHWLGTRWRSHLVSYPSARHGQGQGAGFFCTLCRSRGGAGARSR
jgi:2-(1,2-epoxy-1,2-dihydrophenyl)acetyl-CoA isomerase